jgi:hypothetical protein
MINSRRLDTNGRTTWRVPVDRVDRDLMAGSLTKNPSISHTIAGTIHEAKGEIDLPVSAA